MKKKNDICVYILIKISVFSKNIISIFLVLFSSCNLFSQSIDTSVFPDCITIKELNINTEETLLEKNRYLYNSSKDTLSFIYCYGKKTNNTELQANSLVKLASYTINHENDNQVFERFMIMLNRAIEICEKGNFTIPLINSYELLCSNFTGNKLYDLATLYANKFIETAYESGDSIYIAEGYMHLGRILREKGEYSESDAVLNNSLKYLTKGESSNRIGGYTYLHLANLKRLEGKYKASIAYAEKGISLVKNNLHYTHFQRGALALEAALSNIELGNFDNEKWFRELTRGEKEIKWLKGQQSFIHGQIFEKEGLFDEAINSYLEALNISNTAGNYHTAVLISNKTIPLLKKKDISPRAFEIYQISQGAIDKLIQQNGSNNLLESAFFKIENEKYKSELLYKDLKKSHWIISFSIFMIILILIIILFVIRQNRKTQKLNSSIQKLNIDLEVKNQNLKNSNQEIEKRKEELTLELKQELLLLNNQNNMIRELSEFVSKNKEINPMTKQQILKITDIRMNNAIVEDINLKFLELNNTLLTNLSSKFPNLTSNNLKLCLYLSMNLTTKEIAQILYVSPDSVKMARSRLRKKLNLKASSEKLSTFLIQYKNN